MLRKMLLASILPILCMAAVPLLLQLESVAQGQTVDHWTHRGRTAARPGFASQAPAPSIVTPRFIAPAPDGCKFIGQSAPVVAEGRIFVYATRTLDSVTTSHIIAYSEADGSHLWTSNVARRESDSWSAPTVYSQRKTLLMPSGKSVTALDTETGLLLWQTPLGDYPVVNGTVMVYDKKAYVANHRPVGSGAMLYCLNLDPDDQEHEEGEILWSQPLVKSVGSEAALAATATGNSILATDMAGYIRQFHPDGSAGWTFALPGAGSYLPNGGFNGGLAVDGSQAFAATYNFYGPALLVCVNAATGQQIWSTPCERTDSVPVIGQDKIFLSGGVIGYGSQPKIEAFARSNGQKLWEWTTSGAGGWTMQPILIGDTLYLGDGATINPSTASADFYALDVSKTPADAGFVKEHYQGCGSSPAYANGNVYTLGAAGLYAFGPTVGGGEPDQGPQVVEWASLAHHGLAGTIAIAMTDGFVEPRYAGLRTLRVTFDQELDAATVTPQAIIITDVATGATIDTSAATVSLDTAGGGGSILTITLAAGLPDGRRYVLSINTQLKNTSGVAAPGGPTVTVGALVGDSTGDGLVNSADAMAIRAAMGRATSSANARLDIHATGRITAQDMRTAWRRSGGRILQN